MSSRTTFLQSCTLAALIGLAGTASAGETDAASDATYHLAGLEQRAEIIIDHWGVPHIYAGTHYDAFFVQGFNAARDRLWQIDLWRRRGLGLLSEVFGADFVEQDRAARSCSTKSAPNTSERSPRPRRRHRSICQSRSRAALKPWTKKAS